MTKPKEVTLESLAIDIRRQNRVLKTNTGALTDHLKDCTAERYKTAEAIQNLSESVTKLADQLEKTHGEAEYNGAIAFDVKRTVDAYQTVLKTGARWLGGAIIAIMAALVSVVAHDVWTTSHVATKDDLQAQASRVIAHTGQGQGQGGQGR